MEECPYHEKEISSIGYISASNMRLYHINDIIPQCSLNKDNEYIRMLLDHSDNELKIYHHDDIWNTPWHKLYHASSVLKIMLVLICSKKQWSCIKAYAMGYPGGIIYLRYKDIYICSYDDNIEWLKHISQCGILSEEVYQPQDLMDHNLDDNKDIYRNKGSSIYGQAIKIFRHILARYPLRSSIPVLSQFYSDIVILT